MLLSRSNLHILFPSLLAGLFAVTGCSEDAEGVSDRYAAFTPDLDGAAKDPLAGVVLAIEPSQEVAAIELADGALVDLELGDAQGEALLGACGEAFADGDRAVMPVLTRPLVVGDTIVDAPVLEAGCDAETASNRLVLREEADASCSDGECLSFAAPEAIETSREPLYSGADLTFSGSGGLANPCMGPGTTTCVNCSGTMQRTKTLTGATYDPPTNKCYYTYSYGPCQPYCAI